MAISALDRIDDLVEDSFTLAKQDQAVDETEAISVAAVVDTTRHSIDSDTVTVEASSDLGMIVGHTSSVRTLIENSFRNAVEHGDSDVMVRGEMLDNGFAVEDEGPGISEDVREDVFDPGYTTKDEGTGYGLNIVKKKDR